MYTTQSTQAVARNGKFLLGAVLLPATLLCGCQNMNNTESGALGGGIIGGVLGTIVGAAAHNPAAGALIGAGAGAAVGGLAGASEDRREQHFTQAQAQAYNDAVQRGQAELEEVAKMTRSGVSDANIIEHVRHCGAIFNLSADQIVWLKQNGVSEVVIQAMQENGPRPVYMAVRQPGVVYVQDPAVCVGVSGGYYYGHR